MKRITRQEVTNKPRQGKTAITSQISINLSIIRDTFNELERKYLDLLEKRYDGIKLNEKEEYVLNSILNLSEKRTRCNHFEVQKFFNVIDRILKEEE